MFVYGDVVYAQTWYSDPEKLNRATFICQDGLCCCNMALISFRLFRKNLGNLPGFFGQMVYRPPPWQKISRTPMLMLNHSLTGLFGRNCVTTFPWPGCLRDSSSKYQKSFVCLRKICLANWHRHWVLNTCEESSDNRRFKRPNCFRPFYVIPPP